jgi:hypothetical protein
MKKRDDLYELSTGFIAQAQRDFALYAELEARGELPTVGDLPRWMSHYDSNPTRHARRIAKRKAASLARGEQRR